MCSCLCIFVGILVLSFAGCMFVVRPEISENSPQKTPSESKSSSGAIKRHSGRVKKKQKKRKNSEHFDC